MSDMKKWMPYKSLTEQNFDYKKKEEFIEKPTISNELAEKINTYLTHYDGSVLKIVYYTNGKRITIEDQIKKIDEFNKLIITEHNDRIKISDLLDIEQC
ncbi:MAG: YolD-like family protein [Coprobacillus sp.]|nr:YolD-like family protein [Coprobacillus sp.]